MPLPMNRFTATPPNWMRRTPPSPLSRRLRPAALERRRVSVMSAAMLLDQLHRSGSSGKDQLAAAPGQLGAVMTCLWQRTGQRPGEAHAARERQETPGQLEKDAGPRRRERVAQKTLRRRQVLHRDTGSDPLLAETRAQHQGVVLLALPGEHVEHRAQVVRGDPGMRHVAEEVRLPRL